MSWVSLDLGVFPLYAEKHQQNQKKNLVIYTSCILGKYIN